jgi:hypothetical protein
VYFFPTLMLMPLFEDLDRRARCLPPRSLQPPVPGAAGPGRGETRARTALRARSAVSACTAGAGPAGARS